MLSTLQGMEAYPVTAAGALIIEVPAFDGILSLGLNLLSTGHATGAEGVGHVPEVGVEDMLIADHRSGNLVGHQCINVLVVLDELGHVFEWTIIVFGGGKEHPAGDFPCPLRIHWIILGHLHHLNS